MKPHLVLFVLVFALSACNENTDLEDQDKDIVILKELKNEILDLANKNICSGDEDCEFVGLGSKPCGGFWSYVVYSSSSDTEELLNKVEYYNNFEKDLNAKYNLISDCSLALPPIGFICEDGKCKGRYTI